MDSRLKNYKRIWDRWKQNAAVDTKNNNNNYKHLKFSRFTTDLQMIHYRRFAKKNSYKHLNMFFYWFADNYTRFLKMNNSYSRFDMICQRFATDLPRRTTTASVSTWFAADLPMICHWFADDLPMICCWFARRIWC